MVASDSLSVLKWKWGWPELRTSNGMTLCTPRGDRGANFQVRDAHCPHDQLLTENTGNSQGLASSSINITWQAGSEADRRERRLNGRDVHSRSQALQLSLLPFDVGRIKLSLSKCSAVHRAAGNPAGPTMTTLGLRRLPPCTRTG
eukprot:2090558-Amphidinium_carterae.1